MAKKKAAGGELPEVSEVADLLEMLLGRRVQLKISRKPESLGQRTGSVGVYTYPDGTLGGACAADLRMTCNAGAALALVPVGVAQEAIKKGEIPQELRENFAEVMNVMASLYNNAGNKHRLKLSNVVVTPPRPERDVAKMMLRPAGRLDFEVTVDGYDGGCLTILAA